eukprot:11448634-Alexandrium_andersonii.AAC.1
MQPAPYSAHHCNCCNGAAATGRPGPKAPLDSIREQSTHFASSVWKRKRSPALKQFTLGGAV